MEYVSIYTRKQAIEDGILIDVSKQAKEVGVRFRTALIAAVWNCYVAVPNNVDFQDEQGRLFDILNMFLFAIKNGKGDGSICDI